MFERFTAEARQAVVLAQEEARALGHSYIGSEHILLGLLREQESIAANVLVSFGLQVKDATAQIMRLVGPGREVTSGQIPFTPRAKKVLELALREALNLGHPYIGPEHVLLGLLGEKEGVAARVLLDAGADADKIREQVIRMLPEAGGAAPRPSPGSLRPRPPRQLIDNAWLDGLAGALESLARDIREELGREPDVGDLLLVLGCADQTVAARALTELGVDPDALWGTIERLRREQFAWQEKVAHEIEQLKRAKEEAIEGHDFELAAQLRDSERELNARLRERAMPMVLDDIRRRMGLAGT